MRGPDALKAYQARLCKLVHDVHEKRFGYSSGPCDCFCEERMQRVSPGNWQSTGEALEWLEKLVAALPDGGVEVSLVERYVLGTDGRPTYHGIVVERIIAKDGARTTSDRNK